MREVVIGAKAIKMIPLVCHCINLGHVWPMQLVPQLQIVWGIGKYEISRLRRHRMHNLYTITLYYLVSFYFHKNILFRFHLLLHTRLFVLQSLDHIVKEYSVA